MRDTLSLIDSQLHAMWGAEWTDLSVPAQMAVAHDYAHAGTVAQHDYRYNIGTGNLNSYASCLLIQAVKVWGAALTDGQVK